MKQAKVDKVVRNLWGIIVFLLSRWVAPMPTANRWLTKMGKSTNNLSDYGLENTFVPTQLSRLYSY